MVSNMSTSQNDWRSGHESVVICHVTIVAVVAVPDGRERAAYARNESCHAPAQLFHPQHLTYLMYLSIIYGPFPGSGPLLFTALTGRADLCRTRTSHVLVQTR